MRIIAGEARGRRLHAPPGRTTRPILDALKERLFNILGDRVLGTACWDLFAGAGSLGLEALSRGAASCVFVESDRASLEVLRRNVEELGFGDRARIVRGDALRPASLADAGRPDVVFLDPPFPLVDGDPEAIARLLGALARDHLAPEGLMVLRTPSGGPAPEGPGVDVADERLHGVNRLQLLRKR